MRAKLEREIERFVKNEIFGLVSPYKEDVLVRDYEDFIVKNKNKNWEIILEKKKREILVGGRMKRM